MLFNVPQYIDVEDKVAGPLTAKQLLWMFGMGAALLILWSFLDKVAFFVLAFPVGAVFLALAFYRPYNQPLISFLGSAVTFLFSPKVYSWKRIPQHIAKKQIPKQDKASEQLKVAREKEKEMTTDNLEALAKILDTAGRERNERIMEIIKKNRSPKNKTQK